MNKKPNAPPKLPEKLDKILKRYGLDHNSVWEVRTGAYAILHKAIEVIANREVVSFDKPEVIHDGLNEESQIVILVTGRMSVFDEQTKTLITREQWSYGECNKKNNKNQYPWAMAEKRAKDRVILKLIDAHGLLYSDIDIGDIDDDARKPKAQSRDAYSTLQDEIKQADTVPALNKLYLESKVLIASFPRDWEEEIVQRFADRKSIIEADEGSALTKFQADIDAIDGADARREFWESNKVQADVSGWPETVRDAAEAYAMDAIEDALQSKLLDD